MSYASVVDGKIEIAGIDDLMAFLKEANPDLQKAIRKGLKEASQPILSAAKSNAGAIADDGTFRDSLSISARANGAKYLLRSNDVAAGVKEFAKPGAMRLVGQSSRSSTQRARLRAGLPLGPNTRAVRVGVPHRGTPPRAMVPAVDDNQAEVLDLIDEQMAKVRDKAGE